MADISNKTLAVLLILTIAVSLGGTVISLGKLRGLGTGVTGFDVLNAYGNISVYVESQAAINFTTNATNFGTGTVHESCTSCTMNTSWTGGASNQATCCVGFSGADDGLVLENTGNRNVTVDLQSNKNAAQFIGGTNPLFKINVTEGESGSCDNTTSGPGSGLGATFNNTWANVPTADTEVCDRFNIQSSRDMLNISISVTIPENSQTGSLQATITATATAI